MTHLQTIHTNLFVYVVQIPINLFAFDGSNKIYDFCKGDRYVWARNKNNFRYKFVKKIAVFIPLSLYWITMIYNRYRLFVLFNSLNLNT